MNLSLKTEDIDAMEMKPLESIDSQISGQSQGTNWDEIKFNVPLEKPNQSFESPTVQPQFITDSQSMPINSVDSPPQMQNDVNDSPAHMKRVRLNSVSSTNSKDSDSSVSSGMKEKILNWKRNSAKSPKALFISNPLELEVTQTTALSPASTSRSANEQIDKIAQERLTRYRVNSISKGEKNSETEQPPDLPKKPIKFHINQLEKLLNGDINPPNVPEDKSGVMLLLDSLRVMQSLQAVSCKDTTPFSLYDVPKRSYDYQDTK